MSKRLTAFSDSVFAITATIKVRHHPRDTESDPISSHFLPIDQSDNPTLIDPPCHSFCGVTHVCMQVIPIKLRFPVDSLYDELRYNGFPIVMYFSAFLLIFGIWRHHTLLFDRLILHDETVLWLNLLLLLITTFVPYPLTILGDFPMESDAMLLCVVTFVMVAAVQSILVVSSLFRALALYAPDPFSASLQSVTHARNCTRMSLSTLQHGRLCG